MKNINLLIVLLILLCVNVSAYGAAGWADCDYTVLKAERHIYLDQKTNLTNVLIDFSIRPDVTDLYLVEAYTHLPFNVSCGGKVDVTRKNNELRIGLNHYHGTRFNCTYQTYQQHNNDSFEGYVEFRGAEDRKMLLNYCRVIDVKPIPTTTTTTTLRHKTTSTSLVLRTTTTRSTTTTTTTLLVTTTTKPEQKEPVDVTNIVIIVLFISVCGIVFFRMNRIKKKT